MPNFTRHQIAYNLLSALRGAGLGVRDEFEGRQEPTSWFFRCLAYDQSELDIMESGAIDALHAPSVLVELSLDEVAVAAAAIGPEGLLSYLAWETDDVPFGGVGGSSADPDNALGFHPDVRMGYLALDVAPPNLWMEERRSDPDSNEALARRLAMMAQEVGGACDVVVHFTLDIPLAGVGERELSGRFDDASHTAAAAIEGMRLVFQRMSAGER